MDITERFKKELPAFLTEARNLAAGEVAALDPDGRYNTRVSLRASRLDGDLEIRMRFTAIDMPHFESPCIMSELEADTDRVAEKIVDLYDVWVDTVYDKHTHKGLKSIKDFRAMLGAGTRDATLEDFRVDTAFKPERDLCAHTWERRDDGTFRYQGINDFLSDDIVLTFKNGKCRMTCTYEPESPDLCIERNDEYEIDIEGLSTGEIEGTLDDRMKKWNAECEEEHRNAVETNLEEYAGERRDHVDRLNELHENRADADRKGVKAIDREIAEVTGCVEAIDNYAQEHMNHIDDYVRDNGGDIPELPEPRRAAGKTGRAGKEQEQAIT